MYAFARSALFALEPESAHDVTLRTLSHSAALARRIYARKVPHVPVDLMGLQLPNPIGLAAGLDKDGRCIDGLSALGFGFVEVGTVTPEPQPGNAKPRLFRVPEQRALINRLGFNNDGVAALVERAKRRRGATALGINIGKNAITPPERAVADYLAGLNAVYSIADYITINISSPNTKGLRDMQGRESLDELLGALRDERDRLAEAEARYVPLAVKIAPDLDESQLDAIADRLLHHGIDGVIATNTTTARDGVPLRWTNEAGGLSGVPVRERSTQVIAALRTRLGTKLPIVGVGGIQSARDATDKLEAGATAVQMYTGLIYQGPRLIADCARAAQLVYADQRARELKSVVRRDRARVSAER
ncbi:Dihydroorotate dehydrogenase protein [Salinisphaera shabanensis E1L3A]|uniref:Dihydroorotate dehydrogenase (quinone) n=1 Tax=Salinisphaera shabanensis E1L3A TaxID=1033802 RepID=U2FX94_9GAMM|nr:quinone-dependent dihydroorotate dehydrogenase [Salinisphaera shabanensis]ERJ18853.1 Dihydroorotate dehydrogenase protein [Salinisphaera shabanensis E1L3A]